MVVAGGILMREPIESSPHGLNQTMRECQVSILWEQQSPSRDVIFFFISRCHYGG